MRGNSTDLDRPSGADGSAPPPASPGAHGSARKRRRIGRLVLVIGLAVLIAGIVIALRRDRGTIGAQEVRTRLQAAEREAAARPPRFDVAYVQIAAEDYQGALAAAPDDGALLRFRVVPNAVAERLSTFEPGSRPDIRALLSRAAAREPAWVERSRPYRQARLFRGQSWIVGLLVSRLDPGGAGKVRLEADRVEWRDFREVFDPTEMVHESNSSFGGNFDTTPPDARSLTRRRIEWDSAPPGEPQFVPLYVLHEYAVPEDAPENAGVVNETGEMLWLQIVTDVSYVPRRLLFQRADGQEIEIDIGAALRLPMVLSEPTRGSGDRS